MRIPDWSPELKPQPQDLIDAVKKRRGGPLIELDRVLLWSEPVARGWNVYLGAVRTGLPTSRKLRELGILTVALLTGADYEYQHHAPDFLAAGGSQAELDALSRFVTNDPRSTPADAALGAPESAVVEYAVQVTLDVKVTDTTFAKMKAQFDTTQIVEITTAIAAYNMVARILVPLGVGTATPVAGI
jgi:alkylhydroperoxidase family enzyme